MTESQQFIEILQAKIKRIEALLKERDEKIKGMQNVIDRYRAEVRGRRPPATPEETYTQSLNKPENQE